MRKDKHNRSITVTETVDLTVDLAEFTDDELIEECQERDIIVSPVKAQPAPKIEELAREVLDHLMGRRLSRARSAMDSLLGFYVPAGIVDTAQALNRGDAAAAICFLDGFASPSPAASARDLPKKVA